LGKHFRWPQDEEILTFLSARDCGFADEEALFLADSADMGRSEKPLTAKTAKKGTKVAKKILSESGAASSEGG
jgi:hypothetical protein